MSDKQLLIEMWPREQVFPHPDNYRTVNGKDPEFRDLVASIQANGIIEPLIVRVHPGATLREEAKDSVQVLSGHQRLAAAKEAGLDVVPVRNLGVVADDLAYDIVAMANLHKPLTPLEEGKRAAIWLDKYNQDVKAVASKLGKSERWVVEHAQIYRGLSADWQKAAMDHEGAYGFDTWTASHWAAIAKLPARIQAEQLKKFLGGRHGACDRMSAADVEDAVKQDLLYLSKAPFDATSCQGCVNRSGVQPLLWGDTVEQASGNKERCLDPKCWARKCTAHAKREFKETAAAKGVPDAVPVSLIEPPKDYWNRGGYDDKVRPLKKVFPGLVTADRVEVVKAGAKGAIPAIVVGGKGKNAVKYVRITEKKGDAGGGARKPTAAELAKQKAEEEQRRNRGEIVDSIYARLKKAKQPDGPAVILCCLLTRSWPGTYPDQVSDKEWRQMAAPSFLDDSSALDRLIARMWRAFISHLKSGGRMSWAGAVAVARPFGIDAEAELAEVTAAPEGKTTGPGVCRVCGCTDDDCSQCVEATGEPCTWVEADLCSRCAAQQSGKTKRKSKRASGARRRKKARARMAGAVVGL
ncbi:MAG: ParB N-terminal domain-containing protein, partial [Phycisphaerales bacterium]